MTIDTSRLQQVKQAFRQQYNQSPDFVVRAPGRVELIGNHTDYNDGFVMPAAINRDVLIAGAKTDGRQVLAYSLNFNQNTAFSLDAIEKSEDAAWSNYIRGVMDQLIRSGQQVTGLKLAIEGNVPLGGGLSSSAAIEVATCLAALEASGAKMSGQEIAKLCQRAENQFVGVSSGIMDQFISALGEEGKAMILDCRSLDFRMAKLPEGVKIVVCDTKKPRTLAGSEYNIRRAQCEEAVSILKEKYSGIQALRDVTIDMLEASADRLPEIVLMRARHVVYENDRVLKCADALENGDFTAFGDLLNQSHASSRDLYHNSSPELDILVDAAQKTDGCLGSRLSGAGFGGCTVSIVKDDAVDSFAAAVTRAYSERVGYAPEIDVFNASAGAFRVE